MESKSSPRRSRQPRQQAAGKSDTDDPPPSQLTMEREVGQAGAVVLKLNGLLDLETVGALRDVAFTVIGTRPPHLTIDTTLLGPLDIAGIEALNTIGRVAAMVRVRFSVRVGQTERDLFDKTGLNRLLPVEGSD